MFENRVKTVENVEFSSEPRITLHVWLPSTAENGQKVKIQIFLKSSEKFQKFGGGFTRICLLATEHDILENRAKSIKSRKIQDFGSTFQDHVESTKLYVK